MQVRHTVKLKMKRDFLNTQVPFKGRPNWNSVQQEATVRENSISRQVLPPADFTTGVLRFKTKVTMVSRVNRRVRTSRTSSRIARGALHRRYSNVLFTHSSLLGKDHWSRWHDWQLVGSGNNTQGEDYKRCI